MKFLIVVLFLLTSFTSMAREKKVVYKYKKYEKFDFEKMSIEGDIEAPGDLSIVTRFQRKFSNRLPYRKSFAKELRKSVERIK